MARTTKQLSGGGKDKFLRGLVAQNSDLPGAAAARVIEALTSSISEIRVRRDVWEHVSKSQPKQMPETAPATAVAPVAAAEDVSAVAFDPFAFSAVALLSKKGKPALAAELEKIANAEHLHKLAAAQHLAVEPSIRELAVLRAAIIAGAERRIADRRAAAS
jgi:hypothetical protein